MIARIKGQVSIVQFSGFLRRNLEKSMIPKWGCSSAGRAPALQAGGQEFDPPHLHQVGKGMNLTSVSVKTVFDSNESNKTGA